MAFFFTLLKALECKIDWFVASLWLVGKRNEASGAQDPVRAGYGVRRSRRGTVRSCEV